MGGKGVEKGMNMGGEIDLLFCRGYPAGMHNERPYRKSRSPVFDHEEKHGRDEDKRHQVRDDDRKRASVEAVHQPQENARAVETYHGKGKVTRRFDPPRADDLGHEGDCGERTGNEAEHHDRVDIQEHARIL